MDYNAQENIGYLMSLWADRYNASFVIGQGDNFYWDGVTSKDDPQFKLTFEDQYNESSLAIPFINVMGNHDYGGSSKIPGDGGAGGLEQLYTAQHEYVSPVKDKDGNSRWVMDDDAHYSKVFTSPAGYDIEIFNFDTNHAEAEGHGRLEVCCQVFGYQNEPGCNYDQCKGIKDYKGGCAPAEAVSTCLSRLSDLWNQGQAKFKEAHAKSTAKWKIANTHYHPRIHLGVQDGDVVYQTTNNKDNPVQMYFCGHTHGEGHEFHQYSPDEELGIHIMLNGAGGGIYTDLGGEEDGTFWHQNAYGFIGVQLNDQIARLRYYGFKKDTWKGFHVPRVGDMQENHCWDIPVDGTVGRSCN